MQRVTEQREEAVAILIRATESPLPEARANALEGLSRTPARLRTILPRTLADENLGVRSVSAMVIGRSILKEHAASVHPLLGDPSPFVRMAAIFALMRCGESVDPTPLARFLMDDSPKVRAQSAFILGELGDKSALPMLRDASRDAMSRAFPSDVKLMHLQIAEARVKLGDETSIHEIRAALYPSRAEDLEATALAAQIIGQVNDRAGIDQLIYLTARLNERKQYMPAEVRLAAAGSLARLGLPRGSFLANEYAGDPTPALRAQAAFVYGATGQPGNLEPLAILMADPIELVRISAAAAVIKIADRMGAAAQ